MANYKVGFAYYSVETDRYQDIRIKRLKKDKGATGLAIYDYLLCEIYRVKGCYLAWDENIAFDVADYFGIKEELVNEIVDYCCHVGLFDDQKLKTNNYLTSRSIQKRYIDWSKKAKRTNYKIPDSVIIPEKVDIIPEECRTILEVSYELRENPVQRKVKKSKEKVLPSDDGNIQLAREKVIRKDNLKFPFNSEEFMSAWDKLVSLPKWKKKPASSIQMSLDMLSRYDETYSIMLVEKAHSGNYLGVVFDDTNEKYLNWKKKQAATQNVEIGQKYVQSKNQRKCNW